MVQGTVSSVGLPAPWQEVHAEGLTYYWNTQTNETTYDRPVAGAPASGKPKTDYSYLGGANFEKTRLQREWRAHVHGGPCWCSR